VSYFDYGFMKGENKKAPERYNNLLGGFMMAFLG